MTCTTCHEPHTAAAAQGVDGFDAACVRCHPAGPEHAARAAPAAGGPARRSGAGCVDCHVRRSQPFDLPHVRTADHFIRRRVPPPQDDLPHRQFADPAGALVLFDDGRLAGALDTAEGRRWRAGVLGMGLVSLGRVEEAARQFDLLPPPGSAGARPASRAAGPLAPLESDPAFHTVRALALLARGRLTEAQAAFADALAVSPRHPGALLGRARLRLDQGDLQGALLDTQAVIEAYPAAEQPWDLRVEIAQRAGRPDLVLAALRASTRRWPSNAAAWLALARLLRTQGEVVESGRALARARTLRPALAPAGER